MAQIARYMCPCVNCDWWPPGRFGLHFRGSIHRRGGGAIIYTHHARAEAELSNRISVAPQSDEKFFVTIPRPVETTTVTGSTQSRVAHDSEDSDHLSTLLVNVTHCVTTPTPFPILIVYLPAYLLPRCLQIVPSTTKLSTGRPPESCVNQTFETAVAISQAHSKLPD